MPYRLRYFGALAIAIIIIFTSTQLRRGAITAPLSIDWPLRPGPAHEPTAASPEEWSDESTQWHPIDDLIKSAEREFATFLPKATSDLKSTAAAYRKRRGRHPPPGFDTWFKFAKKHKAIIVEDFWDQIYDDIHPLWALPPDQMRRDVRGHNEIIRVRGGKAKTESGFFWMTIWLDLINTISSHIPDMDIAMNTMDEPRLTIPWEDMNEYVRKEQAARGMPPPSEVISKFSDLTGDENDATPEAAFGWDTSVPYFHHARRACHPDSPARKAEVMTDFSGAPVMNLKYMDKHSYNGYVSNYTLSTSICHQPDLQGLHGAFIEPISVNASTRLFPIFGGSKLATNNELLIPAPMYWGDKDARFVAGGGSDPWEKKVARVIWRGLASGGRNRVSNWRGFHRHRFVAMTNATQVRRAENWEEFPLNWVRPPGNYNIKALNNGHLSDWLETSMDSAFIDLNCYPEQHGGQCDYTGNWFKTVPIVKMPDQYHYKFLPDIDGNSFSGRYRAFLMSNSLPIKATLFREWHDSRLVSWKHFVPMDNRFVDFFGLLEYFLGYPNASSDNPIPKVVKPHDLTAKRIANEGQEWALKVLRREDMQVYTLRLLLEYARVIDDQREKLGFVDDLLS